MNPLISLEVQVGICNGLCEYEAFPLKTLMLHILFSKIYVLFADEELDNAYEISTIYYIFS